MKYPNGMICQSCGYENPEENLFCGKCGNRLALVASPDMVSEEEKNYFSYDWLGTRVIMSKEAFYFALFFILPIFTIIVCLIYLSVGFVISAAGTLLFSLFCAIGLKFIRDARYGYGAIIGLSLLLGLMLFLFMMIDILRIVE